MTRRTVLFGPEFLDAAGREFPSQRSLDYTGPTFRDFMDGPVRAARLKFANDWDGLFPEFGGSVRSLITAPTGVFGPYVFYAALVTRAGGVVIQIEGFDGDPDYWDIVADDPDD